MAELQMRWPGGLSRALTLSYDDGVEQDERLLAIMQQHGLKGAFNLNGALLTDEEVSYPKGHIHRRMSKRRAQALFQHSGQEVALHAATHPHLERLPLHMVAQEMIQDRQILEGLFARIVRGMAYPFGTHSDQVVEVLRQLGVAYARTVVSSHRFDVPTDWLRLPATCHHKDPALTELCDRFIKEDHRAGARLFYLWGHSYEFEQDDNWQVIEAFAARMGQAEGIWHASNIEVYEYVEAYQRLVFSQDGRLIHNPNARPVWLMYDGETLMIRGGETKRR